MFKVKVTPHALHLRSGSGTQHNSVQLLNQGDVLTASGIDTSGTWLHVTTAEGKVGWSSAKYLLPQTTAKCPWLPYMVGEIGFKEEAGPAVHPRIRAYMASVDDLSARAMESDENTAWCSCFVNWAVEQGGLYGTNSASALSWRDWNNPVARGQETQGHIAVFSRKPLDPTKHSGGHVGVFMGYSADKPEVLVLGGNQSDCVRYAYYPLDGVKSDQRYHLLSFRASR